MGPLFAGLAVLALLLVLMRGYIGVRPRALAKGIRFSGGILLALITVALVVTGRAAFAFITAGLSWALLFRSTPPWQRPDYGAGASNDNQRGSGQARSSGAMSRVEALKVLGLEQSASEADVRAAHRRLIQQTHPDKGGTSYLAAKINEAKDVLLKR